MGLKENLHNIKEKNKDKKWLPAFSAFHTFLYTPNAQRILEGTLELLTI